MKYNCLVVVYNLVCENSITLNSLLQTRNADLNIIVCDNSIVSQIKKNNVLFSKRNAIKYIDMEGNSGLSIAYNRALQEVTNDSWLVIFDQDSKIDVKYFDKLSESIVKYPDIYMHVPIVNSKKTQISPSLSKGYSIKKMKHSTSGLYRDITAINSGMAVKKNVFEKTGNYNEDIFLDYLDHHFVREYRKKFVRIAVFDCEIVQNFSNDDHSDYLRDLKRFEIYSKDFYEYCKDSIEGKAFYAAKILYRSIKLSILHKRVAFLKVAIERRFK